MTSPQEHFQRLEQLLALEAEAEKQELLRAQQRRSAKEAEASGETITNLVIREEGAGLGGRILLTFGKRNQTLPLPWTRLGVGSPVVLSEEAGGSSSEEKESWRGIVSRIRRDSVEVAFNQWLETDAATFRLDRATDEISRARQRQGMDKARGATDSRLAALRDVLLGKQKPTFNKIEAIEPINRALNESQKLAVEFALSAEDVAIIHGPPGTGKTTTLIEIIRQLTRRGERVLAVAASNLAVDNILERLVEAGEQAVRLGHPARVSPTLREHTLDLLVENHPELKTANKIAREARALQNQAGKFTRAKPEKGAKQAMRQEAKDMLKEARRIEDQVVEQILDKARVVCATSTGLDADLIGTRTFDWCIMDEASQSTEPATWIPLQYANRLILAGDHCQLPPTVISHEAIAKGFNVSLMERLLTSDDSLSRMLNIQYRMHQSIMSFSSDFFYGGNLQADESVRAALLPALPHIATTPLTNCPIHFIDTAGASYDEEPEPDGDSRMNPLEAELVIKKLNELLECGVAPEQIAIISPYSAQVKLLREKIFTQHALAGVPGGGDAAYRSQGLEIDSVDGFQGREKEVIVVSLVRSNRDGEVGFLADTRRMNVALTRAKRKLIVIGDSATITTHPFYEQMVKYFESVNAYHSVWEEQ